MVFTFLGDSFAQQNPRSSRRLRSAQNANRPVAIQLTTDRVLRKVTVPAAIHHEFFLNHGCIFHHLRVYEGADRLRRLTLLCGDVLVVIPAH